MQQVQRQSRVPKPVNVDGMLAPSNLSNPGVILSGLHDVPRHFTPDPPNLIEEITISSKVKYVKLSCLFSVKSWSPVNQSVALPEAYSLFANVQRLQLAWRWRKCTPTQHLRCLVQVECTIYRLMKPFSFRILYINLKPPQNVNSFWVFSPKEIQPWKPLS